MEPEFYIINNSSSPKEIRQPIAGKSSKPKADNQPVSILIIMTIVVLVAVFSTAKQWVQGLKSSFLSPIKPETQVSQNFDENYNNLSNDLALKIKDTDNDGLSDYDELDVYLTSPYLEDTDSDGIKDGDEIKNGTDPNCPKGGQCETGGLKPAANVTTTISGANVSDLSKLTPEQLRTVLINKGVPKETVDKLDDETLRKTFLETLGDYQPNLDQTGSIVGADLTPAQIRQMLIDEGVTPAELENLSDQDLLSVWKEIVNEVQSASQTSQ
jgi:hypothetical protein